MYRTYNNYSINKTIYAVRIIGTVATVVYVDTVSCTLYFHHTTRYISHHILV